MLIFSVIVCYNPQIRNLSVLCDNLYKSNSKVIIIDNTEKSYISKSFDTTEYTLIEMCENTGIAKAQNVGILEALKNNADVIVFFDQDSEIKSEFITNLLFPFKLNQPMILAPVFYDIKYQLMVPKFDFTHAFLNNISSQNKGDNTYSVNKIISSGSAVTKEVFDIVGLMDEDYFIDFVDIDFFLRCMAKNISIVIVPNAVMLHSVGERTINLLLIRLFVHSDIRTYYKVRNSFLFFRKKHVPFFIGIKEILSALVHNFLILFFVENKMSHFSNYLVAIYDGFMNKKGKKQVNEY